MPIENTAIDCSPEKSAPEVIEKDSDLPAADADESNHDNKPRTAAAPSGDRALVLMDLDDGLVGWDSDKDPENPQ